MLNDELLQRLRALSVPLVAEALAEMGLRLEFAPGFRQIGDPGLLVGTAVTLHVAHVEQTRRGGYSHFAAALESAHNVCAPVLVVQSGDIEEATWNLPHAAAAKHHGILGAIVDGATRDINEQRALPFPVYATHVSPWGPGRHVDTISVNEPVHLGGEEVDAGDIVLVDRNGIVLVPDEELTGVLERAEQHKARRDAIRQSLESGGSYDDIMLPPAE